MKEAKQLKDWLAAHPEDRKGPKGEVRQANLTDNESAKMATAKGVIQVKRHEGLDNSIYAG